MEHKANEKQNIDVVELVPDTARYSPNAVVAESTFNKLVWNDEAGRFKGDDLLDKINKGRKNAEANILSVDDKVVLRPLDPDMLAAVVESSSRLKRSIVVIAKAKSGVDYDIGENKYYNRIAKTLQSADEVDDLNDRFQDEYMRALEYVDDISMDFSDGDMSKINDTMYAVAFDEEVSGNGYLEVIRNAVGDVKNIKYLPCTNMYRRNDPDGADFAQIVHIGSGRYEKTYFKRWEDKRKINKDTGEVDNSVGVGNNGATEVIQFYRKSSYSEWYGVPMWMPAIAPVTGNVESQNRTIAYFRNDCMTRVFVVADTQIKGFGDKIERHLSAKAKGSENNNRVAVFQPNQPLGGMKANIQVHEVGDGLDKTIIDYRTKNDREIAEVFGLSEIFYGGSTDVNKSSADALMHLTFNVDFEPERLRYEWILNNTIMKQLDLELAKLVLIKPTTLSELDESKRDMTYIRGGAFTVNDLRDKLDLERLPEDWANYPLQVVMQQVGIGMYDILAPDGTSMGDVRGGERDQEEEDADERDE